MSTDVERPLTLDEEFELQARQDQERVDQLTEAILDLERPSDSYIRWPWAAVDAMTSGMSRGDVWYTCAFSGVGKTTFVASATNRWLDQGRVVCVLPLETQPKRFRTILACQRTGISPGDAFSGLLRERNDGRLKVLTDALHAQYHTASLHVSSVREINLATFHKACSHAKRVKADVLIVDHVDHIAAGDGSNLYAESVKVNRKALNLAQDMGLLLVLCSQLNTDALRNQDHLAKFQPPREQFVKFGTHKREIATGMLGLYRPVRGRKADEDPATFKELMRKAKVGEIEPHHALMPHTMGVVLMKDRNYGADGRRTLLSVYSGRVEDREERADASRYGL